MIRPRFIDHLQRYGELVGAQPNLALELMYFKIALGLPCQPIETYTTEQIQRWETGSRKFGILVEDFTPSKAYDILRSEYEGKRLV
jgi:hypothetical protein